MAGWRFPTSPRYNAQEFRGERRLVPRKYHRPPTTKRRKSKKTTSPNVLEPLPESQTDNSTAAIKQEVAEETAAPVATEEYVEEAEEEEVAMPAQVAAAGKKQRTRVVRHLVADYSYVLSEVRLSIGLAVFLIVALIITGILR